MKGNYLKHLLTLLVASFTSLSANAYDAYIDGIYYNLDAETHEATVTHKGEDSYSGRGSYSGNVTIPSEVRYEYVTYNVKSIGESAFTCCLDLTSVIIPDGVTNIGNSAFSSCSGLTSINIPIGVTKIGEYALYYCNNLTSIVLPETLKIIGNSAFAACWSLTSIDLPSGVTNVEDGTFSSCSGLTTFTFPEGVTSIGSHVFWGCSKLTSVTIPSSVMSIENGAFSGCTGLTSITVAADNAMYDSRNNCNAIIETATNTLIQGCRNTIIPNSVTKIGNSAFYRCSGLTSINIPSSVTSIGSSAFDGCESLTSITIPSSVKSIASGLFECCTRLSSLNVEAENTVYDSRDNCNAIIETATNTLIQGCCNTIIPKSVTKIGNSAFYWCSGLTSIDIPSGVTNIGDRAFYHCNNLTSIVLPESLTSIGSSAFGSCEKLTSIALPAGLTDHAHDLFNAFDHSITSIISKINDPFEWYGFYNYFDDCMLIVPQGKRDAYISAGWTEEIFKRGIMEVCFDETIIFADSKVKDICVAHWDLNKDGELDKFEAATVAELGEYFRNTDIQSFNELQYFVGLKSIGERAFEDCNNLTSVFIPKGVTTIERDAYEDCEYLTSIFIPEGVTSIGEGAFRWCRNLTGVVLPESLTSIGYSAFESCDNLTSVALPDGITCIESSAFSGCRFSFMVLPENLTCLGYGVFPYGMKRIISKIENPFQLMNEGYSYDNCELVVPHGTRDAYLAAGWTEEVFKAGVVEESENPIIYFLDDRVKEKCVSRWDTNGDGELDYEEAAAVTSFDYNIFDYHYETYSFPELQYFTGLESIDLGYFSSMKAITIPKNVRYVTPSCGLLTIKVSKDNPYFDSRNNCNAVIETASNTLIAGCRSTVIPNTVTNIGDGAFQYCSGLTTIAIPSGVTTIGSNAFSGCMDLTALTIPSSVTSIGNYAFRGCQGLTSVTIPSGVVSIGEGSFEGCSSLTSVTIPSSVTGIGGWAFSGCNNLTTVKVEMEVPFQLDQWDFNYISENCILIVPRGTRDAYIEAGWTEEIFGGGVFEVGIITAKDYTIQYGDEIPTLDYDVVGDAITGDPAVSTSATLQSPIGEYPITISQGSVTNGNYNYVNGTLTITKAPLTITGKSYTMVRGEALPTFEVEYSGFKNGQTNMVLNRQPTITCSATSMSAPGTYDIIVSGATAANYEISYVKGTLTIVNPSQVDLADGEIYTNDLDMNLAQLSYSRTFKNTEWQPWYVPFNLELTADVLERFSFGKFAGTYTEEDGTFYISITRMHAGDVVKANTPYFVKAKTADEGTPQVILLTEATLYAARETGFSMYSAEKKVTVQGIYNQKVVTEDDCGWYAFSGGKYSLQNKLGNVLNPFRFYLTITDREDNPYASTPNPTEVKIKVLGEETGIAPLSVSPEGEKNAVYDLSGRRVDAPKKGIYIINGKKTYVR